MAAGERIDGRCLCGTATFRATLADGTMSACHCEICRRWTSGPFLSVSVRADSLAFDDEATVGVYVSSREAERGFCRTCGSTLFWRALDGSSADVSAQLVEDPGRFDFATEIYVDKKPRTTPSPMSAAG
ncbi:GFA family protein [Chenggangzhangella methanolivorans]|uniref:GFA family protein n=1 Tax=Chenggangzhangella methanolivorans TaxID=1437009 RepID=UPI0021BD968A|nr:GFA family protein [Chenggangzhangella methanolivorans]